MSLKLKRFVRTKREFIGTPELAAQQGNKPGKLNKKSEPTNVVSGYINRLILLVPAEVIALFPVFDLLLASTPMQAFSKIIATYLSVLCVVLMRWILQSKETRPQGPALIVTLVATSLWLHYDGGYFYRPVPEDWQGLLVVAMIVFVIVVEPFLPKEEVEIT